ncbi:ATP-binding protein [Neobacillus dielmonensis]|uniref:ATP-binding protein n=1 Tax=Neobacillus dielmonensis TaxID=1347369 RepID=UPI000694991E|nr:ATP-binding protein [Neobacillus dielmonensis]
MDNDKFILDFVSNQDHYYLGNNSRLKTEFLKEFRPNDFSLYKIVELTFDDQAPRKEAFENVISALQIEGVSFIYLILGNRSGVQFYFGVARDLNYGQKLPITISDIGSDILKPSLQGNFRGSTISEVTPKDKQSLMETIHSLKHSALLEGVPGINEENKDFQGVDRLIDVMLGDEFGLVIIASPLGQNSIMEVERNVNLAYSAIAPLTKKNIQEGTSIGSNEGKTKTVNYSESEGQSYSKSDSTGTGDNKGGSRGTTKQTSKSTTKNSNDNKRSDAETGSEGSNTSDSWGTSTSNSTSVSTGTTTSKTTGNSASESTTITKGENQAITVEWINKEAQEWLKYLDEVILPRLDYGKSKGIFITNAFLLANNKGNLIKLGNTMRSLYSGRKGNKVPLRLNMAEDQPYAPFFKKFQLPNGKFANLSSDERYARALLSQFVTETKAYLGSWLSTNELSLIAGLPQKEVVGLSLKEEVEFGLNFSSPANKEETISLGNLVQSGRVLDTIEVSLDKEHLNKHVFITGVTGSGKTTTCQKLLMDSALPFLVIEPAKTEYRILNEQYDDLLIFTLGKNTIAPFRLNPFEFFPHESITSRVDMIMASLEASFDMEAAIPQILESAVYECYEDYGWNISTNVNEMYSDPFADGVFAFPTLEDLLAKIERVVVSQGFDDRLKNDYVGSIKARLQGLLVGSKGLILNTKKSVDFETLLEKRVILELEEIKSGSEKSLIMGFILTNLTEAIKAKFIKEPGFKHITLVEEAHRLLSKYVPGESMNKKQSVEVFTDMLAEVRKYGESLIIVDQIPDKLTSEVLKNTNTKIVHKIFARDDKEAIGNTMALTDEQKNFLSYLDTGRAIVFTQGWNKAMQVQIKPSTNTTGLHQVPEHLLRERVLTFYQKTYRKGIFPGLEFLEEEPSQDFVERYIDILQGGKLFADYGDALYGKWDGLKVVLEKLLPEFGMDMLVHVLAVNLYRPQPDCSLEYRKTLIGDFLEDIMNGHIKLTINNHSDYLRRN